MHEADLHHSQKTLEEKLQEIFQLRRTTTKVNWDQDGYRALLEKLGNPHKDLPPVIHVAGTNGKGSVIAMLRSILVAAGYRVHAYTSPHLVKINERIVLDNQLIEDDELERRMDEVLELNDGAPLSFFEITTALAFKAFSEHPADVLLLEVGMGGALDCTNVVEKPLCCVINRISYDHTEFLGDDITKITEAKAGIMKPEVPCIVGYQGEGDDAEKIYAALYVAAKKSASNLLVCDRDWLVSMDIDILSFERNGIVQQYNLPNLTGDHQIYNAGVALCALDEVKDALPVSTEDINAGLATVTWAGRLQNISPVALRLPSGNEIWLDSGHNDSAGQALAVQVQKWRAQEREVHMIIGMLDSKKPHAFLNPILPHLTSLNVVPIQSEPHCFDAQTLRSQLIYDESLPLRNYSNVFDALDSLSKNTKNAVLLVAGSVYLCGEVLSNIND